MDTLFPILNVEREWYEKNNKFGRDPTCFYPAKDLFSFIAARRKLLDGGYTIFAEERKTKLIARRWKNGKVDLMYMTNRERTGSEEVEYYANIRKEKSVAGKMGRSEHPADPAEAKPAD